MNKRRVGRPMISRETKGYDRDLADLGRLRSACLIDTRITTKKYAQIAQAVQIIEKVLRSLPKGEKGR